MSLYLAICLRILSDHLQISRLSIDQARGWIRRLAVSAPTPEAQRLVAALELQTGIPIAQLANIAVQWAPEDESWRMP